MQDLQQIYSQIDALERSTIERQIFVRWREQAGLGKIRKDQLKDYTQEVPAGDRKAQVITVEGPEETILTAIYSLEDATWFIKLKGESWKVEDMKGAFLKFLGTVRF